MLLSEHQALADAQNRPLHVAQVTKTFLDGGLLGWTVGSGVSRWCRHWLGDLALRLDTGVPQAAGQVAVQALGNWLPG